MSYTLQPFHPLPGAQLQQKAQGSRDIFVGLSNCTLHGFRYSRVYKMPSGLSDCTHAGVGKALATEFVKAGDNVVVSSRSGGSSHPLHERAQLIHIHS